MYNDSIDTLLLRHYGSTAPTPEHLEQRIVASVRQESQEMHERQHMATRLRDYRVTRRRAIQLVAMGSAGLGLLSTGFSTVQAVINGSEQNNPAYA